MLRKRRFGVVLLAYLFAYFAASWLDLYSTALGLERPGTSEKNVFATTGTGAFDPHKAWLLTVGGGAIMLACLSFAMTRAKNVSHRWLERSIASFGEFHLNPFSRNALEVTPLHSLCLVLAFPMIRVVAAYNNLLVYLYGWGPLGATMQWIAQRTTPLAGFATVALMSFAILMVLMAPIAARLIRSWQAAEGRCE